MIRGSLQPMKSAELVEAASPIGCCLCEATNTRDAEYCRRCGAPMALAHQAMGQTTRPRTIAILGPGGAGKTTYLGMLMDMLSQQLKGWQIIARGAFSIRLQQTAVSALARCRFPARTGSEPDCWNWMHCEIHRDEMPPQASPSFLERLAGYTLGRLHPSRKRNRCVELIVPDVAGDVILGEVEHPQTNLLVRGLLRNSAAAMLFIDAGELGRGQRDADFAAMKILVCLKEIEIERGLDRMSRKPVAIVFTKVDQAPDCRENPEEYARDHAPGVWQHIRQDFRECRFFAASVAGCCTCAKRRDGQRFQVPLRVEPRGIIEPLEWLMEGLCFTRKP
jgi:hypothetical protein